MSIRYITCAKRRGNKSRENVEVWGKMAARHAEKCGGSKAPSFQRRSFNRAKDALLFKLLRRTRKRERDRSTFMRIFSTELLKANLHFNVHNIFVLYYNTVFVQNGQNES